MSLEVMLHEKELAMHELDLVITDLRMPRMDGMTDCNVLILGETGTGKKMVAKVIHHLLTD